MRTPSSCRRCTRPAPWWSRSSTPSFEKEESPRELFSFLSWVRLLEPVTPGTLAAETGIPPTTIRDYLRRLSERGDIVRRPNPRDGRSYLVKLTPRGRRLVDRGAPMVGAVFRRSSPTCRVPQRSTQSGRGSLGRASQPWPPRTSETGAWTWPSPGGPKSGRAARGAVRPLTRSRGIDV